MARQLLLGRGELGLQLRLLGAERRRLRAGGDLGVLRDRRAPSVACSLSVAASARVVRATASVAVACSWSTVTRSRTSER